MVATLVNPQRIPHTTMFSTFSMSDLRNRSSACSTVCKVLFSAEDLTKFSHSTCQTCSLKTSPHSWSSDLLTSATVKLRVMLLPCEPPVTSCWLSETCLLNPFWFVVCLLFFDTSGFQASFNVVGNSTYWHRGFRFAISLHCTFNELPSFFLS